jgi:hypothetical protein
LDRKLNRTILLISVLAITTFIGGIFAIQLVTPSFRTNQANISSLDNIEANGAIPLNYTKRGVFNVGQDSCCGHTDTDAPTIRLLSPPNDSTILDNTIINLHVRDNNLFYDYEPKKVSYHLDSDTTNTTLEDPYDLDLPTDNGSVVLYVYAVDYSNNWASAIYHFRITTDPSEVTYGTEITFEPEDPGNEDYTYPGFLLLPIMVALIGSVTVIRWKRRKH